MNIDYLKIFFTIIGSLATTIISISTYYFSVYKFRKMKYAIDSNQILEKTSLHFKNNFINPTIEEHYFFLNTGIDTNHKTIPYYIKLKEMLGENFTWKRIRNAKIHLKFNEKGKPFVKLYKIQIYWMYISLIIALISFLVSFFIVIYTSQIEIKFANEIKYLLIIYYSSFIFFMFGFFMLKSVESIYDANFIKKRLDTLKKNKHKKKKL